MLRVWKTGCVTLALSAALSACTTQSTIDRAVSAEDKELALGLAKALCDGSIYTYQTKFDPELWVKSQPLFPQAIPYCPEGKSTSRLLGYHFNTQLVSDGTVTQTDMIVISESAGKWTTTTLTTLTEKGSSRIVSWNMNASAEKPAEVAMADEWDSKVIYFQIGIPLFLLALIGGVVWFFRRSRKAAAG